MGELLWAAKVTALNDVRVQAEGSDCDKNKKRKRLRIDIKSGKKTKVQCKLRKGDKEEPIYTLASKARSDNSCK